MYILCSPQFKEQNIVLVSFSGWSHLSSQSHQFFITAVLQVLVQWSLGKREREKWMWTYEKRRAEKRRNRGVVLRSWKQKQKSVLIIFVWASLLYSWNSQANDLSQNSLFLSCSYSLSLSFSLSTLIYSERKRLFLITVEDETL